MSGLQRAVADGVIRPRCRRFAATLVVAALHLTACSSGDDDTAATTVATASSPSSPIASTPPDSADSSSTATTEADTAPTSITAPPAPIEPAPNPQCALGPDRTITELPDETAPAIVVEDYEVPAFDAGDVTIPAVRIPGFTIPQRTLDAGCRIDLTAPAGCLGAVEMSSIEIPEIRVPGFVLEAVEDDDGEELAPRVEREDIVLPAARRPAVSLAPTCEVVADGTTRAIIRPALTRPGIGRPEGVRPGVVRPPICVEDACSAEVRVPDVVVPVAGLADVVIPELYVQVESVPDAPEADVVTTPDGVAFTAPVDVLFDVDSAALRPEATTSLEGIVAAIADLPAEARITVEGHTDSDGEADYNLELSRQRAQAVTDFLTGQGGLAVERISTIGRGEEIPAATNDTPEGKALNRRVVILVATG